MKRKLSFVVVILLLALGLGRSVRAQELSPSGAAPTGPTAPIGNAFTYQGQLTDTSGPVTGNCDFQFGLWDALSGGAQVGTTLGQSNVAVSEGLFTVQLDFGATAFIGGARWLEVAVRCPAGGGSYTTLTPRQPLTAAPYANIAQVANVAFSAEEAGNADTLDGLHASAFQQQYQNLVVVAKSGGDFTTITDALGSITDNGADNPYTIYVAPGVYSETVTMKPYVDIEGAGEATTKITATSNASPYATVKGTENAELRFLTVENTGGQYAARAIYNFCSQSLRITHVTVIAAGGVNDARGVVSDSSSATIKDVTVIVSGGGQSVGVYSESNSTITLMNVNVTISEGLNSIGVYNFLSSSVMSNVTIAASGGTNSYGVYNDDSSSRIVMTDVTIEASGVTNNYAVYNVLSSPMIVSLNATASGGSNNYGVWNEFSSPTIKHSIISASDGLSDGLHNTATGNTYTINIDDSQITGGTSTLYQTSHYTTRLGASQLIGAGVFGGTYVCVASYNGNYAALNSSCQP